MRLAGLFVLLAVAGCREAPPALTTAGLQGDWILTEDSLGFGIAGLNRSSFTIRGDSVFDPDRSIYAHMKPTEARAWEPLTNEAVVSWSLVGDTLTQHGSEHEWRTFVRLPTRPSVPRPERIAIRFDGCFGPCPVMDAEIDSSGTLWHLEEDDAEPLGRFVAHGRYDVYDRLSTLAAGLRLDLPHPEVSGNEDDLSTLLVAWYDGEPHVFYGTAGEFGPLLLIVAEMANAAWTIPMEETATRHHFASQDISRYSDKAQGDIPQVPTPQVASRLIAPPPKPFPNVLDQLMR